MKKNLLIAAALVTAIGVSAQVAPVRKQLPAPRQCEKMMKSADLGKLKMNKIAKVKANAPEASSIYDDYIYTYFDWFDGVDATSVGRLTIKEASGTLELKYYENKDGSTPSFDYNVEVDGFAAEDASVVYGVYDEEAGELLIPVQDALLVNEENGYSGDYGPAVLTAFYEDEESGDLMMGAEIVFVFNDDGTVELAEDLLGWYSYLPEDLAPSGNPYGFTAGEDLQVFPVNGSMDFRTSVSWLKDEVLSNGYDPASCTINVTDWETQLVVNGFLKESVVSIELNDDGTCWMPLPQISFDYETEYKDGEETLSLSGAYLFDWDDDGNILDGIVGYVDGNYVRFFADAKGGDDIWDEEGYLKKDAYNAYLYLGYTNKTSNGGFLGYGFNTLMEFEWTAGDSEDPDPQKPTGIENFNNTLEYKLKNTPTYNLMGQQVSRKEVKGLMIRDGKKYIAK